MAASLAAATNTERATARRPAAAPRRARASAGGLEAATLTLPRRAALRRALLAWYGRNGRALPWRETRDPYRIWVSEIMLQQTQVSTATPYYERFVARFPSVSALARAPLDDVLAAWSGLGYYRRARHLHAAAAQVVRDHGGRVPRSREAFGALPGVGPYTRGAVLSIGFGAAEPVVDGNVARVLARWFARDWRVRRPADAKRLWALAAELMPAPAEPHAARGPGDWNQALMELGARVCTPRAPRCGECPVRRWCRANALGTPEAWPPAAARRTRETVRRAVARIERGGRVLVTRREGSLLRGLWEPPGVELRPGADAARALRRALGALGVRATLEDSGRRVRHAITHRSIEVEVWSGSLAAPAPRRAGLRWADPGSRALALTATGRRVARAVVDFPVSRGVHSSAKSEPLVPGAGRGAPLSRIARSRAVRPRHPRTPR